MAISTLNDLLFHVREVSAGRPDLLTTHDRKRPDVCSTTDFLRNVHSLALALGERGVEPGDRVAIFSENRVEWHVVDFACHLLGAVVVPLYPTLPASQIAYILRNSGARRVFYSDRKRRDVLREVQSALASPVEAIAFDGEATLEEGLSITRLMGSVAERRGAFPIERFRGRVEASDLASIVYTSGTTADPKGVMLSHGNLVSNLLAAGERFRVGPDDLALSFLPLSHVFQRTVDYLCFHRGVPIVYLPAVEQVARALPVVRPTILTSVPRVYERAWVKIESAVAGEPAWRRHLFRWAVASGHRWATVRREGIVGPLLALRRLLADRLVLAGIRERFGGRVRLAISGGAPLGREVGIFFEAIGMPIYQGYGLTETSPVVATNAPGSLRQGTVGRVLPGVELQVADDGELLVRGPGVTRGYWENPDASAELVDEDGWLHTGDVGTVDREGYVVITDRKKDVLVTSGGKNVAPLPIEGRLLAQPGVEQAIVVGDGYPYLTALLSPDRDALGDATEGEITRRLEGAVAAVNGELAQHERLRRFAVLPAALTVEDGSLTPTLKVKRRVVAQRHADLIASMYTATQKAGK